MQKLFTRPMVLVLCFVALSLASCSSSNKGKIVGKWKANDIPETAKKGLPPGATIDLYFEFTADGRFIVSGELGMFGTKESKEVATGNYSLGMGNSVTIDNIKPPLDGKTKGREKISINGDTMTVDSENGQKLTFTRVK